MSHPHPTILATCAFAFVVAVLWCAPLDYAEAAYPTVVATNSANSGANTTATAVTMPSGVVSGNLLIVMFTKDGTAAPTSITGTGWTSFGATPGTASYFIGYYKVADGSDTLTVNHASEGTAYIVYRITGHDRNMAPAVATSTGTSAQPDPPSLDPGSWGTEDTLWIASYGWDNDSAHSAYPQYYTDNQTTDRWASTNGGGIAAATVASTTASQNPATSTIAASRAYGAMTIAIRPDPSPQPNPLYFSVVPAGVSTTSVSMTATTATDSDTPVEYYFTATSSGCSAGEGGTGGTDSGWQSSASYTDTGLQPGQCYGYLVTARDSLGNRTATSTASTTRALHALTQRDYIFLNDNGSTTDYYTQSHSAATSTAITNVKKGERLVARIQIDNTGNGTSTTQYRLQYDKNEGNWTNVGTTTEIRWSLSQTGALGERYGGVPLTVNQVTASCNASAPTYQAGRFVADTASSTVFSIRPSKCTELAYAIETSGATLGQLYRLRAIDGVASTTFSAYVAYPTLTIESTSTLMYSKEARGSSAKSVHAVASIYTSLAIGTDGFPIISYQNTTSNFLEVAHCTDIACAGRNIAVLSTVNSFHPSLAIGADGFPIVAYYDDGSDDLMVAHCTDIACTATPSITTLDNNNIMDAGVSIAIGTDGFPVIVYHSWTLDNIKVAKCIDTACVGAPVITIVDTNGPNGGASPPYYISFAIGTDGFPVITYVDATVDDLKVAKCIDTACVGAPSITTLDTNSTFHPSLAIGTDGFPVIVYQAGTSGARDVYVAKCINASCTGIPIITVVENTASNLAFYTSLAIGTDGFPIISYQNTTSNFLEVAKCSNIACAPATSSLANLPTDARSYDTYLDDAGYTNVASSDNLYDSLTSATSSRLAYSFKKASSTNTDAISITWEG